LAKDHYSSDINCIGGVMVSMLISRVVDSIPNQVKPKAKWKRICVGFVLLVYVCIAVGDPVIKRGGLGSLNQFNSATCLYMFQVRTWISNVIGLEPG
jgi:hypothetical protein